MLAPPEVEAGDAGPWLPGLADATHFKRSWGCGEPVVLHDRAIDREVVYGEDVGALKLKHEEHLGGPASDTANLLKAIDHGLIVHLFEDVRTEVAAGEMRGEAAEGGNFLTRLADGAELLIGEAGHFCGGRE